MSADANKATARRIYDEVVNGGNIDLIDEVMTVDMIEHEEFPGLESGREGAKQFFQLFRAAFPDLRFEVHDMVGEEGIGAILKAEKRSAPACRALVSRALENGGTDNVTVVLAGYAIPESA